MGKIQSIRGMHDILPGETERWQWLEARLQQSFNSFGYREIRMPVLESTALFKRSIGEVTDIVEKEMYTFDDRNGDSLTLRPEGTAGCVRACEQHGMLYNQVQRLWYAGPMFRHERPQKGRQRQFHQVGVEAFGMSGPDIDAELILLSARCWEALGISDAVELQLNSLGLPEERARHKQALVEWLTPRRDALDEDSRRRLDSNPLRILDSKNPDTQALLAEAPSLSDFLGEESRAHFEGVCALLDAAGVAYRLNPRLVRGLDYYSLTVFEWVTEQLGAQGTVCAGGRYDSLVEQLGGRPTPAVGFAMGMERLCLMLDTAAPETSADIYLVSTPEARSGSLLLADDLRRCFPQLRTVMHCGTGGFKSQFKRADKLGARCALILGEEELAQGSVGLKWLRLADTAQQRVGRAELMTQLATGFADDEVTAVTKD